MARCTKATSLLAAAGICSIASLIGFVALSDPLPPDTTYRPLPTRPLSAVKADDEAQKPQVMARQSELLNQRYDLANRPIPGVMMSGAKKPVQGGVRVKLPPGVTWDELGGHDARRKSASAGCYPQASCLCHTSSRLREAKSFPTGKSMRSGARKTVTCVASTSTLIFLII